MLHFPVARDSLPATPVKCARLDGTVVTIRCLRRYVNVVFTYGDVLLSSSRRACLWD